MFGIHFGRPLEKIIAVADIGSGSAAVAFIAVKKGAPVRILAAERRFLPLEERSLEAIIAALGRHLVEAGKQVLTTYGKSGGPLPQAVYAIFRSPWTHSKTLEARQAFPKAVRITSAMIGELAQKALARDTEFDRARLLEAGVIRVEINGYATNEPEGKFGEDLSVSALISDCDPNVRTAVVSALQELFGARKPIMRSGVRALLSAVRSAQDALTDFLIVDMAGEGTNVIVVRDGVTTDHASTTEGKSSLIKRITNGGMPEDTLTLLRLIARGECHDPACQTVETAMAKAEPELVRIFGEVLGMLVARQRLPNHLILATHPDLAPWLSSFFSRIDFAQFTTTTQPFTIETLKPTDLAHSVQVESTARVDLGILISASLVNIEENRAS